jgi:hypothetical protein
MDGDDKSLREWRMLVCLLRDVDRGLPPRRERGLLASEWAYVIQVVLVMS